MNKFTKKVLTSITSLSLLATMTPTVSLAAKIDSSSENSSVFNNTKTNDNILLKTLKDNEEERIVQSSDDNLISTSKLDKKTNQIEITVKNIKENTTSYQTIDLERRKNLRKLKSDVQYMQPLKLISSKSNTLGGYAYYFYTNNIWVIQIPERNAKNVTENDKNSKDLTGFRNSIISLDQAEMSYIGKVGGETAAMALAAIETPTPWTVALGILTALGIAAWSIPDLKKISDEQWNCVFYFERVTV
ncbi:geobacillin-26 family protein [Bacillus bombysepticus]|uniref:Uncharacterized protein n=1 Tax=Bacillus thuringiensis serovar kumamotoensis TaxID=132267 RepID=A0A9X6JIK8_BACUK|nr:geobacillin-26 family protein [Bacillus thuringiensis]MEC2870082.1 geobacillin-26 family protein [Bacillus cereus]OTZ67117.1 hypothetical protein BK769_31190 [Bacillus thuringiensis serovar kumamtoensis]